MMNRFLFSTCCAFSLTLCAWTGSAFAVCAGTYLGDIPEKDADGTWVCEGNCHGDSGEFECQDCAMVENGQNNECYCTVG